MDLSQLKKETRGYLGSSNTSDKNIKKETKILGRPQKYEEPLNQRMSLNFTKTEKEKIELHCEETGVNISVYLRRALKKAGVI